MQLHCLRHSQLNRNIVETTGMCEREKATILALNQRKQHIRTVYISFEDTQNDAVKCLRSHNV